MKIAVLSFTSGKVYRGVETVASELCKRWGRDNQVRMFQMGLSQEKHLNYIIRQIGSFEDWRAISGDYNNRLIHLLMLSCYHRVMCRLTKEVIKELNIWRPEIILPMNRGWQALLTRLFCWQRKIKMVVSGQAGFKDRWSLITRPDIFVALNERNARWTRQHAFGVRVEMIPNGVDLKRFKPIGKKLKLDLERPVILCVAGGERYKRVEETIRAVTRLKKGSLLLAGGSQVQEQFGNKMLGTRFLRKQFLYKEMPAVYLAADVFTLVSESSEAFAIAYLEALASGLPVVAPADEWRREVLRECGIYVQDATDENEYAKQLGKAIKRGKNQPKKWLTQYDWNRVADLYLELFNSLIH